MRTGDPPAPPGYLGSHEVPEKEQGMFLRPLAFMKLVALALVVWPGTVSAQSLTYPATRRDSVVDVYFGARIADPFRWLEQLDGPATVDWVALQRRLTEDYLARLPGRERIRGRLAALWTYSRTDVPWREAGR